MLHTVSVNTVSMSIIAYIQKFKLLIYNPYTIIMNDKYVNISNICIFIISTQALPLILSRTVLQMPTIRFQSILRRWQSMFQVRLYKLEAITIPLVSV